MSLSSDVSTGVSSFSWGVPSFLTGGRDIAARFMVSIGSIVVGSIIAEKENSFTC